MEYTQGMAKMRGAGTGATAGYGNGGGFGTSTAGATGAQTKYDEAGGVGAGSPGGAYDANQTPEFADTKHIQPGGYTQQPQQPAGYQQKPPMESTIHTGTDGGTGQNYDTSLQTGSAGDKVGGPGSDYEANKTSDVADMKQSDQYNKQQSADSRYEEPIPSSTGIHDTRPGGESQQR